MSNKEDYIKKIKENKEIVAEMQKRINEAQNVNAATVDTLEKVLADTFVFYFKAHSFHWNVEGLNFPEYHEFLGKVYEQTFDNVDPIAEHLRMLDKYAPNSLTEIVKRATLVELTNKPGTAIEMFNILKDDNNKVIDGIIACRAEAEKAGITNLANYMDELLNGQRKLAWMLESITKG